MNNKRVQKKRLKELESTIKKYKPKIDELNHEIEKVRKKTRFAG